MIPIEDIKLTGNHMRGAVLFFTGTGRSQVKAMFHMEICYRIMYDHVVTKPLAKLKWESMNDLGYAAMWQN